MVIALCAPSVQQVKTVDPSHFGTVFPAFPVVKVLLAYVCNEYEEERRGAFSIVPQCPVLYLKVQLMYSLRVRALFVVHCHQDTFRTDIC